MIYSAVAAVVALLFGVVSPAFGADQRGLLFSDDFSRLDPELGFGLLGDEEIWAEAGKLTLEPAPDGSKRALYREKLFTDADIRLAVAASTAEKTFIFGLVFWGRDEGNYYAAVIRPDGTFGVSRITDRKATDVVDWKVRAAVKVGADRTNRLRIVTRGTTATCYVNDQVVATFQGEPPAVGGRIGVYAESGFEPGWVEFDDLRVLTPLAADDGEKVALQFELRGPSLQPAEPDEGFALGTATREWAQSELSLVADAHDVQLQVGAPNEGARQSVCLPSREADRRQAVISELSS